MCIKVAVASCNYICTRWECMRYGIDWCFFVSFAFLVF